MRINVESAQGELYFYFWFPCVPKDEWTEWRNEPTSITKGPEGQCDNNSRGWEPIL